MSSKNKNSVENAQDFDEIVKAQKQVFSLPSSMSIFPILQCGIDASIFLSSTLVVCASLYLYISKMFHMTIADDGLILGGVGLTTLILLFVAAQRKTSVKYLKRRNQFSPVQNAVIDAAVSKETTMKSISVNNAIYFLAFTLLATYVIPRVPLPINEEISCGISMILPAAFLVFEAYQSK